MHCFRIFITSTCLFLSGCITSEVNVHKHIHQYGLVNMPPLITGSEVKDNQLDLKNTPEITPTFKAK